MDEGGVGEMIGVEGWWMKDVGYWIKKKIKS